MKLHKSGGVLIYFFGALGGLLFGFDTAVISGALLFIKRDFNLTNGGLEGLIVTALTFGAIFGALASGPIADRFGRRKFIVVLGALFTIGGLGCGLSVNITMLILFRFLLGLSVGAASGLVPLYLAEMAPTNVRGRLSSLNIVMNTFGMLMGYVANNIYAPSSDWRAMLLWAVAPSVILMVGMIFMPESPRWLFQYKGVEAARQVLLLTRNSKEAEEELSSIQATINAEVVSGQASFKMLREPWLRPVILAGVVIAILQQTLGAQTIAYYEPTILQAAGFSDSVSIASTIGIGLVLFMGVLIGMNLVDRWGRKKLLMFGSAGMAISMFLLAVVDHVGFASWSMVVLLSLFMGFFGLSWAFTPWIVIAEIFPLKIRGMATGLCTTCLWITCTVVAQLFPMVQPILSSFVVFLFFTFMCLFSIFFVARFVPETTGRSLEQIEADLMKEYRRKGKSA
ncbi:MFS transporter, sugar porter (SP) family [Priestia aryabhattai B8W22]|uniref:sugar porter family MFS transporter n=1 Tax=Priestia aryabhattai TaxID=412384 RepID=UPI000890D6D0|nr:MFS transporter, sugar porter (SP) family [Priestia aryabhattai B8W22]